MVDFVGTDEDNTFVIIGPADNRLNGMGGNDYLSGGSGNDIFDIDYGTIAGSDSGIDVMRGNDGDDTYGVDNVSDQVIEDSATGGIDTVIAKVSYTLSQNVENLTLSGSAADGTGNNLANTILGNSSTNTIDGRGGADYLDGGGGGSDTFVVDNDNDVVVGVSGTVTDFVTIISSVNYDLTGVTTNIWQANADVSNITLTGQSAIDAYGNDKDNIITGNVAINTLDGGAMGKDTLDGGGGGDLMIGNADDTVYYVDNVNDVINDAGGTDTMHSTIAINLNDVKYAGVENLYLEGTKNLNATANNIFGSAIFGNSGKNVLTGGNANDILGGGQNTGNAGDTMSGGLGDDTYFITNANDIVRETAGQGTDEVVVFTSYSLSAGSLATQSIEKLTLVGSAIYGVGNALDNTIIGNSLDNTLDGKAGADSMSGGDGDDIYYVDTLVDFVDEILDQGNDTVIFGSTTAGETYALTTFVENLTLTGSTAINGTGNAYGNTITGNSAANTLDGAEGVDTLIGGAGNDVYVVDEEADVVTEAANQGTDTVLSSVSYVLGANLENLTLTGTLDIDGTGNSFANTIIGNSGINTLDGGVGNDRLIGGDGDDYYIIDSADVVFEATGEGIDTIESSVSVDLSTNGFGEIENIILTGTQSNYAIGNDGIDNTLTGNDAGNTLDGKTGADTMIGGAGDDTYFVDDVGDVVTELLNQGTDTVMSSVTYTLSTDVENITLTGSGNIDATGNDLDNTLTGNSGNNVLTGGLGDDVYVIDAGDTVAENLGEGNDTILSSITFSLAASASNVENLTLTGSANIDGTGDAGDNTLTGNAGINTLTGGAGNDTYYVGTGDVVVELAGEGTDTVVSNVTFVLNPASFVENLTLGGTAAINGTGDNGDNVITGNSAKNVLTALAGNDTLDGGIGADTMIGGTGDDTYYVDNTGDVVTEQAGEGTDIVHSTAATYTLSANLEDLYLDGTSDINGTGNASVNFIFGNSGNNTIDGGVGADFMIGGAGDDTYIVDNAGDFVSEGALAGNDTVRSSVSWTIAGFANIENITLTGTANIDATGNAGNNTLVGNSGVNTLVGGDGDDVYYADSKDTVIELAGEGNDTLIVTITSGSYTIPANFENIIILGKGNISLVGDTTSNTLTGGDGKNTLDGGGGADYLAGGKGNDTYIVDDPLDLIIELSGGGTDVIYSSASYVMPDEVEKLYLTGTDDIDATGNISDNIIYGNDGNNTLDGGGGTDKLYGGKGDDSYVVDTLRDSLKDTSGVDSIFTNLTYTLKNGFENLNLTGTDSVNGTGTKANNVIVGNEGANVLSGGDGSDILVGGGTLLGGGAFTLGATDAGDTLDGGRGADTMYGGDGDDVYIVDNNGDVVIEDAGQGTDTILVGSNFALGLTQEVEIITLTGKAGYSVSGSDTDNTITGNDGANRLFGMGGADTLDGGLGNDLLDGGDGDDYIIGGAGQNDMTGGDGADTFLFTADTAFDQIDNIMDFTPTDGDVIDISDLLTAYTAGTDTLSDFVQIRDTAGGHSVLQIDADGAADGSHFVTIAILRDVTGLTGEEALVASGNLIVS